MSKKKTINISDTMLQICSNIKQAREAKGFSQQRMANLMGVERNTYKNWEDKTEPSLSILKTIAGVLEVPTASLLVGVVEFGANDIIQSREIQKKNDISEIRTNLNKLTLAIGRLAGLQKEEIDFYLPPYSLDNKAVFEDQRTAGDKKDKNT